MRSDKMSQLSSRKKSSEDRERDLQRKKEKRKWRKQREVERVWLLDVCKEMGEMREWLLVVCPLLSLSQNPFECCFTSFKNSAHVELRIS